VTTKPRETPIGGGSTRTLQVRLFASVAALALVGMMTLAEVSIRQHRTQTLESIARSGIRWVMDQPLDAREAMLAGGKDSFQDFGAQLVKNPDIVFVRLQSSRQADSWVITRDAPSPESNRVGPHETHASGYRLVRRGPNRVLEIAIPLARIAQQGRPQTLASPTSIAAAGTLWLGLDATQAHASSAIAVGQTRQAQALAAALILLALWIVTRRALRPIEMLVEDAERMAIGEEIKGSVPIRSAESRRLQRALARLADPRTRSTSIRTDSPSESRGRSAPDLRGSESKPHPTRYSALRPAPQPDDAASAGAPRSLHDRAYRVLLVEDNPVNQAVAVHMLEELGCRVECARDGVECVTNFDSDRFDLVFMDIQMPRMDGLEATRKIRESEAELDVGQTPIIALTAHSQPRDRTACRRVGMNGHIGKPFTKNDLEQALLEWGEIPKGPRPGGEAPSEVPTRDAVENASIGGGLAEGHDQVLDREAFLDTMEACGSDDAFLRELVDAFMSRARALGATCDRAISDGDRDCLESAAHELKSSSGQLGAKRLQETARALETQAAAGGTNLAPLGAALLAEIELACSALREIGQEKEGER
jgi:CheY-like chemotaxis protein/HPt (histidine-containing phosphotransfer) domain-containing protein